MKAVTFSSERKSSYEIKITETFDNKTLEHVEREEKKETFFSSTSLINENINSQLNEEKCANNKKSLVLSVLLGMGNGVAMMPIFNREVRELEKYGIDIHDKQSAFIASTLNTLFVLGTSSVLSTYRILTDKHHPDFSKMARWKEFGIKTVALGSAIMPVSMLWDIELNNRSVSKSYGFDEFIAYATACTIPLMIYKVFETYEHLCNSVFKRNPEVDLSTLGSKIITYGTCILSAVARGISYSVATVELCKQLGIDEQTSEILGSIIGGMVGSISGAAMEYSHLKNLFKKQNNKFTPKEIMLGCLATVEGVWFSLPVVSEGLKATENWNPLLKGIMFAPLMLSRTVMEASHLYNSVKGKETINMEV